MWGRLYRWALRAHPNKSRHWVVDRYFGMFNPFRDDRWVFGDRDSGIYLRQFAWTKIVRHKMVMGTASPDDPALDWYWASRRRKAHSQLGERTASLLLRQRGVTCSGQFTRSASASRKTSNTPRSKVRHQSPTLTTVVPGTPAPARATDEKPATKGEIGRPHV